jgi:outer membrane immunogenic protein
MVNESADHFGGRDVKKLLFGSLALAAAMAAPAMAADMPVKAAPPVSYYDWSGAYVGFNIGGVWSRMDRTYPNLGLVGLSPSVWTFTTKNDDTIYGFHAGAQWQWGQWILGVEAAYEAGFREMRGATSISPPEPFTNLSAYNKITNLFTVGPRLGYAWDRFMIYGTGGYAVAQLHGQYMCTPTGLAVLPGGPCNFFGLEGTNVTGHSWNQGWFAGAGFEYMVHKGALVDVILGAEYQHFDLQEKDGFHCPPGCPPIGPVPQHINFSHNATGDIVRARLTIKTQGFGWWGPM